MSIAGGKLEDNLPSSMSSSELGEVVDTRYTTTMTAGASADTTASSVSLELSMFSSFI